MKVRNKLESGIWNLEFESLKFAICNVKEGRKGSLREGGGWVERRARLHINVYHRTRSKVMKNISHSAERKKRRRRRMVKGAFNDNNDKKVK